MTGNFVSESVGSDGSGQQGRLASGVPGLDEHLGGGYLPGTLIAVVGATGIGKTQLGLHFVHGVTCAEPPGVILDLTARGDSQNHVQYAKRMFGQDLGRADGEAILARQLFERPPGGRYIHAFSYSGRRVTRDAVDWEQWHQWQAEINRRLSTVSAFLYGHFVHGVRRAVFDGIEPVERASESIQHYLLEYVYHQVVRKESDWVARDILRQDFLQCQELVRRHAYPAGRITCMALITSKESYLEDLVRRPLEEGDLLSNAATLIYMGKVRDGSRLRRALYIAKHRGSACSDEWLFYCIGEGGLFLEEAGQ
ncbi:MAG: recombinase RecA [Pirellulaceae bacterium]|nr:MAG: recombinase RecA [Pirellulaceae bacterium]